ncbi:diguanylate cyclase [Sphingomonas sp. R-74633]|uniref:GGDEF domain-containing protein n=1 Tax=Sphingomonas sp. R-74633 TaxID=2751188 RepID=UPI0015D21135|nr:diguanylate cyclase [Sphingomonas sp. R-74633]NYT40526.1 diguanylate cyclase [Sphingomonas sp. R-74633]
MLVLRFLRLFALIGASIALCGAIVPAQAQPSAGRALTTCVLRDSGEMNPAELIRHPERFDCKTPQYKLGAGDFWAITGPLDAVSTIEKPLRINFASLWQRQLSAQLLYADGSIHTYRTDARGITPLIQLGALAALPAPPSDAKLVRVLWHIEGAANVRGILLGAALSDAPRNDATNLAMAVLYAAFGGMCLALIVYNFALWCAMRYRFQLHYCVLLAVLIGYALSSSGAMAWLYPDIVNNDRLRFNYLFLGLAGGATALFTLSFFEMKIRSRRLDLYTRVIATTVPVSGLIVFLFGAINLRLADMIYTLAILGLISIVVPTLWQAWKQRSHFLWLFSIAWSAPIALALMRILANLHVLPWSFWLDNSTVISMMFEALVSALAVAYRIKFLREERDEAITREVLARRLADTDPLTGLLNRRAFLAQALGRPGEQQLLIADIDHFKRVNETLGHDGGDEVLRLFARTLRTAAPADALVARIGGEEFALLANAAVPIELDPLLNKLRQTRMPFDLKVTASIGACTGPLADDRDWKALYRAADIALFEAKSAGRDRARARREAA